jgi:hypothetical protein
MKVNPNLFPPNATPPRTSGDASEARRAFEAMLSASAARTRTIQAAPMLQDGVQTSAIRQATRTQTEEPTNEPQPLSRPGRVLDIRV